MIGGQKGRAVAGDIAGQLLAAAAAADSLHNMKSIVWARGREGGSRLIGE